MRPYVTGLADCATATQGNLRCEKWLQVMHEVRTLGTIGFSRVRGEFSVLAEGRHIFGRRPKPRAAKPREKPLARSGAFYRPR